MSTALRTHTRRIQRGAASLLLAGAVTAGASLATAPSASAAIITNRCTFTGSQPTLKYAPNTYKLAVKQLQCELNYSLYYTKVKVDGYFGSATLNAVKKLQKCSRITVDGAAGPNTWSKANSWARSLQWADKPKGRC